MTIDFSKFKEALMGDLSITVVEQGKAAVLEYGLAGWNSSKDLSSFEPLATINKYLQEKEYYRLDNQPFIPDFYKYRLAKPDWTSLHDWLRVYYNELESKTEYGSKEETIYQRIIGLILENFDRDELFSDLTAEMFDTPEPLDKLYEEITETIKALAGPPILWSVLVDNVGWVRNDVEEEEAREVYQSYLTGEYKQVMLWASNNPDPEEEYYVPEEQEETEED